MAYKDEYEVARLYADGTFRRRIEREFEGPVRLTFHLAPPLLARPRAGESEPRKLTFGPWMLRVFGGLAKLKRLRGTLLDPFGWTAERRLERRLIRDYEALLDALLPRLSAATRGPVLELARMPEAIRGFGPVKARAIAAAETRKAALLAELAEPPGHAATPGRVYSEAAE
jgi:indolepyruvate ferredoxin oxidoreductase